MSREQRVVEAATDVFLRYGFARTTMGDIAEGAGLSRPALYLVFASKNEVFGAVIERLADDRLAYVRQELPGFSRLDEKVSFACVALGMYGYELMAAHPNAKDLFDLAAAPVRTMYAKFQALIVEIIADAAARSAPPRAPELLARIVTFAIRGFRETAVDALDMRRMIDGQVALLLAVLTPAAEAKKSRRLAPAPCRAA